MLLAGFCRVIEAERTVPGPVGKSRLTMPLSAGLSVEGPSAGLTAWPNPMRDRIQFVLHGAPNTTGILRIIDAAGRNCLTQFLSSDAHGRLALVWDGADEGGRRLPSGAYQAVMQTGRGRAETGFTIIR